MNVAQTLVLKNSKRGRQAAPSKAWSPFPRLPGQLHLLALGLPALSRMTPQTTTPNRFAFTHAFCFCPGSDLAVLNMCFSYRLSIPPGSCFFLTSILTCTNLQINAPCHHHKANICRVALPALVIPVKQRGTVHLICFIGKSQIRQEEDSGARVRVI